MGQGPLRVAFMLQHRTALTPAIELLLLLPSWTFKIGNPYATDGKNPSLKVKALKT